MIHRIQYIIKRLIIKLFGNAPTFDDFEMYSFNPVFFKTTRHVHILDAFFTRSGHNNTIGKHDIKEFLKKSEEQGHNGAKVFVAYCKNIYPEEFEGYSLWR